MTTAVATCASCGANEAVGAVHVFRGAGIVLRCPHCGSILITIAKSYTAIWIGFGGVRTVQFNV